MRTAWKILAGAGIVLVVLLAGVVVAVSTLDVNAFIGPITDRVKAATGRDLAVRGGARLSLSLQPRLVLSDVTLTNAPWGSVPQMLTAQRLELEVALLPLLSRRFELTQLDLVGPVITLETDAQGQKNWVTVPTPGAAGAGTGASPANAIGIGNIAITNGAITYRDGASGSVTRVAVDHLLVHATSPASPISAQFRGKVNDVPMSVEGTLGPIESLMQQRWPYPVSLQGEIAGQKTAVSAKITAADKRYTLDELRVSLGGNAVTGKFAVMTGGARPALMFDLSAPVLALKQLPLPVTVAAAPASTAAKAGSNFLFPDVPIDFAGLRLVDAQGTLAVGRLTLADDRQFDNLRMQIALDGGRLAVSNFSVATLGGTIAGGFTIDAVAPGSTALTLELDGRGLTLGAILAATGKPREVRGGKTDVSVHLAMRGASPHAWAASASGTVQAVLGTATLVKGKLDLDTEVNRLLDAVNPFRASDPSTELVCAVARLPLAGGIARIDRSIGMETQKLGVSASGTLDFRNETLDFTFQPKVRKGITISIPNIADLVRVSGPFAAPRVSVDAAGSVKALASIGAAVGTAGLSAVGQTLFAWSEGSGPGPCQVALGASAATQAAGTAAPAGSASPVPLVNDIGRAVGKLFGK